MFRWDSGAGTCPSTSRGADPLLRPDLSEPVRHSPKGPHRPQKNDSIWFLAPAPGHRLLPRKLFSSDVPGLSSFSSLTSLASPKLHSRSPEGSPGQPSQAASSSNLGPAEPLTQPTPVPPLTCPPGPTSYLGSHCSLFQSPAGAAATSLPPVPTGSVATLPSPGIHCLSLGRGPASKNVTSCLPEALFQVSVSKESVTTFRHTKAR